ncbi:MAG: polysaccharide deacetylase family protein, partial [Defluviitaleaceae bacterium]|nr:polysaccharide deacetylase family protein [Defluviitaleaceae bacterium]
LNEIISSNVNTFVDEFTEVSTKSQIFIRPQINVYSEHILGIVMNIIGLNDLNGLINTLQITYFDMWNNEQIFGEDFFGDNVDYRAIFAELANGFALTGSEPFVFNDENILLYIPNANFYGAETNFGFTSFAMPMIYFNDIWQSPAETRSPRVALTFDDGPHYRYTTMLLDILAEHDALATFFPLGANIANNADIIRRMHNEGHSIGNHSFSHRSFTNLTADQIRNEINQANDAIYAITGQRPTLLRPPYGNFESRERTTINIVQEMGMSIALWSVDTRDWEFRDAIIIRDNILRLAQDGSVILLHDIREPTIRGVAMAMEALAARGFRFVTFEELYRPSEINIEPGSVNRGVYWDISRRDRGIFD